MNTTKIKEALETGLNYVLTDGWTRYQELDAQDIQDAIAELESEKPDESLDSLVEYIDTLHDVEGEPGFQSIVQVRSWLDCGAVGTAIQQYAESYHKQKCAECGHIMSVIDDKIPHDFLRFESRSGITTDVDK